MRPLLSLAMYSCILPKVTMCLVSICLQQRWAANTKQLGKILHTLQKGNWALIHYRLSWSPHPAISFTIRKWTSSQISTVDMSGKNECLESTVAPETIMIIYPRHSPSHPGKMHKHIRYFWNKHFFSEYTSCQGARLQLFISYGVSFSRWILGHCPFHLFTNLYLQIAWREREWGYPSTRTCLPLHNPSHSSSRGVIAHG